MQRRIQQKCLSGRMRYSYNSTGDLCTTIEFCNKPVQVVSETDLMFEGEDTGQVYQILSCGHIRVIDKDKAIEHSERNKLWDKLLPFQQDWIEFAEGANLRCTNEDRMGLGKTVQVASLLRENIEKMTDNYNKYCVYISPVGSIFNVKKEIEKWVKWDKLECMEQIMAKPQVVVTTGQTLSPFAKIIIIPWSKLGDKKILKQLKEVGVASIIVDECHFYKDIRSERTKNMLEIIEIIDPDRKNKFPCIFMSGTITENRVMELAVPLNILDPNYFYSWEVLDQMCVHSREGKALGIHPMWRPKFFDRTKRYRMGRSKDEVQLPLPELRTVEETVSPFDFAVNREVIEAYNTTIDELQNILYGANRDASCIIGLMQQLRHHTGRMKIMAAATWADAWMTMNPGKKLTIGVHHIFVREALAKLLAHRNPLQMSDEAPEVKDEIEDKFRNGGSNLLICSILSAGVGRNFQFCRDALLLERQWNRSKEDQFIERFHRIIELPDGRIKTNFTEQDRVTVTTMNCDPSFDEFFDAMIDLKGIIVDSTDDGVEEIPDENFMVSLAHKVVQKRMRWVGV